MGSKAAAFRALAGNRALVRVVAAYALFTLTEYAVWIAMLVYALSGGRRLPGPAMTRSPEPGNSGDLAPRPSVRGTGAHLVRGTVRESPGSHEALPFSAPRLRLR